ncbi:MAG: hypothetical protein FWF49_03415 [Oscillospiraceae bacterium]|nr:hypothetical protein [Oscillospiraceae bacterium]
MDSYQTQLQKQLAAYAALRNQQAAQAAAQQNAALDIKNQPALAALDAKKQAVPAQYAPAFDKAVVDALIAKRQIAERAAGLGLTNSGMAAVQQKGAGLKQQSDTTAVAAQRQSALNAVQQDIDTAMANISAQKQINTQNETFKAQQDIANNQLKQQQALDKQLATAAAAAAKSAAKAGTAATTKTAAKTTAAATSQAAIDAIVQRLVATGRFTQREAQYMVTGQMPY